MRYKGRKLYLLKAEGPAGTVGRPGEAISRLVGDMGIKIDTVIMIDAALKLEGEKTGDVAEGIGARYRRHRCGKVSSRRSGNPV